MTVQPAGRPRRRPQAASRPALWRGSPRARRADAASPPRSGAVAGPWRKPAGTAPIPIVSGSTSRPRFPQFPLAARLLLPFPAKGPPIKNTSAPTMGRRNRGTTQIAPEGRRSASLTRKTPPLTAAGLGGGSVHIPQRRPSSALFPARPPSLSASNSRSSRLSLSAMPPV